MIEIAPYRLLNWKATTQSCQWVEKERLAIDRKLFGFCRFPTWMIVDRRLSVAGGGE